MYDTKYKVHSKADLGILSIHTGGAKNKGDPYVKKRGRNPTDDRFKGKQFALEKKTGDKLFSKFPFIVKGKNDPYNERISFLKLERRRGFGSSDPAKRDEFSHTIMIQKRKEMIKKEIKAAKKFSKLRQGNVVNDTPLNEELIPDMDQEEIFEYDQVYGLVKGEDDIGKPRTKEMLGSRVRREIEDNPLMKTTSKEYGVDCERYLKKYSKHARTKSTEQFYDKGHLHIECH